MKRNFKIDKTEEVWTDNIKKNKKKNMKERLWT